MYKFLALADDGRAYKHDMIWYNNDKNPNCNTSTIKLITNQINWNQNKKMCLK